MQDKIITRFPPSPTGYLHIGGVRTALFNWLYAKKTKGSFILRIEDTDTMRSTKVSVDAIIKSLEWLGIDWDQGPYFQSQRHDIYQEYIEKLIKSESAYYCSCTPEQVDAMRKKARHSGLKPMYDGTCRDKNLKKDKNMVVRLKTPKKGSIIVEDIVKKDTAFQNKEIDDFIIQRSDGTVMYNFAVVIDDITMSVNTIIRGDDHFINTPKQMLIYQTLRAKLPVFAHVPMVLGPDKTRLSKRHGAMSVSEYKDMGFLPDAMINYLVRLGWSHGDQEFFTRKELIKKFDLEHLGKSASMFDSNKLLFLNAKHIQTKSSDELAKDFVFYLDKETKEKAQKNNSLNSIITSLQQRSKTLVEMAQSSEFYFQDNVKFDPKATKKFLNNNNKKILKEIAEFFEKLDDFKQGDLENVFKIVMQKNNLGFGKIAQPLRVALTGTTISPGIFEMLIALGKEQSIKRIKQILMVEFF